MIGLDTNVLLRFLLADDVEHHAVAKRFIETRTPDDPAFVSSIVIAEAVWFLRSLHNVPRSVILATLRRFAGSRDVVIEDEEFVKSLLDGDSMGDIADNLIARAAHRAGAAETVTFDRKAAARVPGMSLLS